MTVNFIKDFPDVHTPEFATSGAAGADLYVYTKEPVTILPHETHFFPTGLHFEIPDGYVGLIYSRSGISTKRGLILANSVGVIDSDYRGEVGLPLRNDTDEPKVVEPGERVAQMIITQLPTVTFHEVADISNTERGANGFGSTGTI